MNELSAERLLRRGGLTFFGRIIANVSHEFNNVMTIIGEVAGLLEDLCALAENGRPIKPERLRRQCALITKQTTRAHNIIKQMNRFAHSVDLESESFDLAEEVKTTVTLSDRLATRKGFRFFVHDDERDVMAAGQRFLVHELLFLLFRALFESGADEGVIDITVHRDGASSAVSIGSDVSLQVSLEPLGLEYANLLAEELRGSVVAGMDAEGHVAFKVTLPTN